VLEEEREGGIGVKEFACARTRRAHEEEERGIPAMTLLFLPLLMLRF